MHMKLYLQSVENNIIIMVEMKKSENIFATGWLLMMFWFVRRKTWIPPNKTVSVESIMV